MIVLRSDSSTQDAQQVLILHASAWQRDAGALRLDVFVAERAIGHLPSVGHVVS